MMQLGLPTPPRIFERETIVKNNSHYNTFNIFEVLPARFYRGCYSTD